MTNAGIQALKGSWDYVRDRPAREKSFDLCSLQVDGENFDEFMKELGVGMIMRMAAKGVKPRLVIGENAGKWHIRSESTFRTVSYDFTPGVPFDETTPDGREVTVSVSHASLSSSSESLLDDDRVHRRQMGQHFGGEKRQKVRSHPIHRRQRSTDDRT